jgi:hypothetical protein
MFFQLNPSNPTNNKMEWIIYDFVHGTSKKQKSMHNALLMALSEAKV